jgi:hypothetical protein
MHLDHISNAAVDKLLASIARATAAPPVIIQATIAAGRSLSPDIVAPKLTRLWAMALPPTWTASEISYQINVGGEWYEPVDYSTGAPLVETARRTASTAFLTSSFALLRCSSIRVRSGSAAEPIVQQAEQTLQLLFLPCNEPTIF